MIIIIELVPIPIKPDPRYLSVIRQQFSQLVFHELDVIIPVAMNGATGTMTRVAGPVRIIISSPVEQRIIKEQTNSLLVTFIRDHLYNVFMIRRVHNVEIGKLCIPHAEPVVMPCDQGNIFHARILCHALNAVRR